MSSVTDNTLVGLGEVAGVIPVEVEQAVDQPEHEGDEHVEE